MGFTSKGIEMFEETGLYLQHFERDGKLYSLELMPHLRVFYGDRPLLPCRHRWREQILGAMNYGIIRLYPTIWARLNSKEAKMDYLKEMTSAAGERSAILPKQITDKIAAEWNEPTEDDVEGIPETQADAELVGGDEFYEDDADASDSCNDP